MTGRLTFKQTVTLTFCKRLWWGDSFPDWNAKVKQCKCSAVQLNNLCPPRLVFNMWTRGCHMVWGGGKTWFSLYPALFIFNLCSLAFFIEFSSYVGSCEITDPWMHMRLQNLKMAFYCKFKQSPLFKKYLKVADMPGQFRSHSVKKYLLSRALFSWNKWDTLIYIE